MARTLLSAGLVCATLLLVACGGGGNPAPPAAPAVKVNAQKSQQPAKTSNPQDDADALTVKQAEAARVEAMARLVAVNQRNDTRLLEHRKQLEVFNKAKAEHDTKVAAYKKEKRETDALKRLEFAKKLATQKGLEKWYTELVIDFPGTTAAKEAQRRLAGQAPKAIAVPPETPEPVLSVTRPSEPDYEPVPNIPEVPTVAQLRQRRETALNEEAERRAEEEDDFSGLILLKKTVRGVQDRFSMQITGTVVNRRGKPLSYAQIIFNVYDDSGAQVGNALANVNSLEAGGRWNFKAVSLSPGSKYRISKLSGF